MADNNQKFKATVKVTRQTETTLKNKPVRKEFDNPYRTSNYYSTRNFDKKDIARQASKDALNKKYERRPDRNNIQEIKDNSINRSNDNTSSVLNTFLNKRKSPYRDSGNVEDVNKKPAYEEEKVNKDKSEQNTQNNNEQANNEKTQENNNPASSKPSDLQPKDELENSEKKGVKERLGDLRNNLLNRNKNKAKEAAKGEVKKKALAFLMKNPYVLLFISALVIILLVILIVIGGGSINGTAYGSTYCGGEVFDMTKIELYNGVKSWMPGLRHWDETSPQYTFYNTVETYTDNDGFLRQGEDYVVALGQKFGIEKGTRYEVLMESGQTFTVVLGDSKATTDNNYSATGLYHILGGQANVLEFIMGCNRSAAGEPNMSKYKGEVKTCPKSDSEYVGMIEEKFPGELTSITKIVDDSECNFNYMGEYLERTTDIYSDTKVLKQIYALAPKLADISCDDCSLRNECPTYAKLRAVEILMNSSLSEEKKKAAISDINGTYGHARDYTHDNSGLKNFGYDASCKNYKAGALITYYGNGKKCNGYYCGHVGIIESVDEKKNTYVLSDSHAGIEYTRFKTYTIGSSPFGKCKNITYLLDYKG